MIWIYLVIANVLSDTLRIYLDNFITDVYFKGREAIAQRLFHGIGITIFAATMMLIFNQDFAGLPPVTFFILFGAGIISACANIPYYKALECDDSTNLGIFIQLAPILYLVLGWLYLGDTISPHQLLAFCIILSAPLLIVLTSRKRSRGVRLRAMGLAFLYVVIDVIGNLLFVHNVDPAINFAVPLSISMLGVGIGNAAIVLLNRKWRRRFFTVASKTKGKIYPPLTFDLILSITKTVTYRGALYFAPAVALASVASDATEPIVIFFVGIVLTLIWPKFGRENLTKKTVAVHLLATILVVIGIVLMQTQNL
ncbi:EamA family transporter [Candidatus Saccharibacteria bacterium]|nr:EamA family transporter [Candidatus Saccharibacteria bacterium]